MQGQRQGQRGGNEISSGKLASYCCHHLPTANSISDEEVVGGEGGLMSTTAFCEAMLLWAEAVAPCVRASSSAHCARARENCRFARRCSARSACHGLRSHGRGMGAAALEIKRRRMMDDAIVGLGGGLGLRLGMGLGMGLGLEGGEKTSAAASAARGGGVKW